MNVIHINAVCRATKSIMNNHFGVEVVPNKPSSGQGVVPSNDVSVVLGVNGQLSGQIICTLNTDTAKKLVGTMMGGMIIEQLDEMSWSAIQEFGNWVAGSTATELSKEDCTIDVTPPVVNDGMSKFRSSKMFISVPMDTTLGEIGIHISLSEKAS
ncbi:chemotaxis protein CheX [Salipaludibacillus keqinensis]|uniref:Chemotaxis protein CheX n=1 Tax=Salipaludibacillus keqinensis TaxID=2045207 RepID=A0A323THM3_9BACI|nr:chemotaxis protein CheC [Salipaludibacillus keqinensis]PYZ94020.1 chemotaxis protein CheX [Salipaludibacillus keqinensis]